MKGNNLILIGFMGSGKTTLGQAIAKAQDINFMDTDSIIEAQEGISIPQIFAQHGEAYFRKCERSVIESLKPNDNSVIACGGGLPCFHDNIALLKQLGSVVYLKASVEFICNRLSEDEKAKRPLFEDLDSVTELLESREPTYLEADIVVEIECKSIEALTEMLVHHL